MSVRHENDSVRAGFAAQPRIVLGVSDSAAGRAALNVAVDIAMRRQLPLHLVRVWQDVDWFLPASTDAIDLLVADDHGERNTFAKICAQAVNRAPHLRLSWELIPGDVYSTLLQRTTGADLLVLGTNATYGSDTGRLGSFFIERAKCPVIVVDAAERIVEYRAGLPVAHATAQ
jgi:nucleotide-binding universal stress UspA family protein